MNDAGAADEGAIGKKNSLKGCALGVAPGDRKRAYAATDSSLPRRSLLATPFPRRRSDQDNLDQSEVCSFAILREGKRSHGDIQVSSGASFLF